MYIEKKISSISGWGICLNVLTAMTSDFGQIPDKVACNLFDTLVKPILTYNSEISFMNSYLKLFRATLRAEKSNSEIDELNLLIRLL